MYNFITKLILIVFYKRNDHRSYIYLGVASLLKIRSDITITCFLLLTLPSSLPFYVCAM